MVELEGRWVDALVLHHRPQPIHVVLALAAGGQLQPPVQQVELPRGDVVAGHVLTVVELLLRIPNHELVAACRDVLRMVSAQEGSDYEDDLERAREQGYTKNEIVEESNRYADLKALVDDAEE